MCSELVRAMTTKPFAFQICRGVWTEPDDREPASLAARSASLTLPAPAEVTESVYFKSFDQSVLRALRGTPVRSQEAALKGAYAVYLSKERECGCQNILIRPEKELCVEDCIQQEERGRA
jgi:hypothetical protein